MARNFSGEALKYFGVTFAVCALILAAVFYFLLPGTAHRDASPGAAPTAVPAAAQPAPAAAQPATAAAAPGKAKPAARSRGKKKAEPEVEITPVEPKIIRQ
jgi:hypothetical protein